MTCSCHEKVYTRISKQHTFELHWDRIIGKPRKRWPIFYLTWDYLYNNNLNSQCTIRLNKSEQVFAYSMVEET